LPVMVAGGAAVRVVVEREEATCNGDHWYKELKQHAREIIDTRNCQRVRCVILNSLVYMAMCKTVYPIWCWHWSLVRDINILDFRFFASI
jgi:hypothetical protein